MSRESKDEDAILEDFKQAMDRKLKDVPKEQQKAIFKRFTDQFEKGFDYCKARRYSLDKRQHVLHYTHVAQYQLRNAKNMPFKSKPAEHVTHLGFGLGVLMAVIEYGCFRNQWQEEASIIAKHVVYAIKFLDRAEHDYHHKKISKRVKKIVRSRTTTPQEQELGEQIIDAFR